MQNDEAAKLWRAMRPLNPKHVTTMIEPDGIIVEAPPTHNRFKNLVGKKYGRLEVESYLCRQLLALGGMVGVMPKETMFIEFPKMPRFSRECIVMEKQILTCYKFSPYSHYGSNDTKEKTNTNRGAKKSCCYKEQGVGSKKPRAAKCFCSGISRSQVCERGKMEGRRTEGCRTKGVDGRIKIQAMHRLRRGFSYMLHGLRPSRRIQEILQYRQHVRASLQSRTYSNRVG